MNKIAVLLAAYNGKQYIIEQVFSILNQRSVLIDLYIRVDGKCEIFNSILQKLCKLNHNIYLIDGDLISNPSQNFYNLINYVDYSNYDFFALADQDDIWKPDKLKNAICQLSSVGAGAYSSGSKAFYPNGSVIKLKLGTASKYDFFFQAGGAGCTYVFNLQGFIFLRLIFNSYPELLKITAHDWLFYYIFRLYKLNWVFGGTEDLMYRQHSSNIAGVNRGFRGKLRRLKVLFNGWYLKDLSLMINFACQRNRFPVFYNPFNLRRNYFQSILIWLYYWLYVRNVHTPSNYNK